MVQSLHAYELNDKGTRLDEIVCGQVVALHAQTYTYNQKVSIRKSLSFYNPLEVTVIKCEEGT